ncbi:MAG: DUF2147 domain-containing protein [Bacteroidota bacterium]
MRADFFFTMLFLGTFFTQAQYSQSAIEGLWLNHDASAVVEIYEEDGTFYGQVHEILKFPTDKSESLSEAQLKKGKEKMKGRLILTDLTFENGQWINGRILNPKDNSTRAKCTVSLEENQKVLRIKIKRGFLSATKNWTRYETSIDTHEN